MELPGGKQVREFPRLRYGGAHLKDEADWAADVCMRAVQGRARRCLAGCGRLAVAGSLAPRHRGRGDVAMRCGRPHRGALARGLPHGLALLAIAGPVAMLAAQYHVLGTDKVGQDVLYQALKSIRTGLVIGTLTTLVHAAGRARCSASWPGYFKGWVDDVIQYVYTTLNSIPGVLLIAAAVLMMQVFIDTHPGLFPDRGAARRLSGCSCCASILGLTSWTGLARLLRGEALKLVAARVHPGGARVRRVRTRASSRATSCRT